MLDTMLEGATLTYLTAVVDMSVFITKLENEGHTPKEIIKHLKTSADTAERLVDATLDDMEKRADESPFMAS